MTIYIESCNGDFKGSAEDVPAFAGGYLKGAAMICRILVFLLLASVGTAHSANIWYIKVFDSQAKYVLDKKINKDEFVFLLNPNIECTVSDVHIDKRRSLTLSGDTEYYTESRSLFCRKVNDDYYSGIQHDADINEYKMHGSFSSMIIRTTNYYYNFSLGYIEMGDK